MHTHRACCSFPPPTTTGFPFFVLSSSFYVNILASQFLPLISFIFIHFSSHIICFSTSPHPSSPFKIFFLFWSHPISLISVYLSLCSARSLSLCSSRSLSLSASIAADQIYGDQEMHGVVRNNCMDYMVELCVGVVCWCGCACVGGCERASFCVCVCVTICEVCMA